jgi:hypothetical protein
VEASKKHHAQTVSPTGNSVKTTGVNDKSGQSFYTPGKIFFAIEKGWD